MHISEGVLSAPVLIAGAALTAGGVALGLNKMDMDEVPKVAVLSSSYFVASLIHIPVGPTSVHLVLNGLNGLLLGWMCFPAILVGLTLQALLFQFGGLTSLGVNTLNMAFPALVGYYLFFPLVRRKNNALAVAAGGACGFVAIFLGAIMIGGSLYLTGTSFLAVAKLAVVAHIPVMIIEGVLTAFCVLALRKIKPELLGARHET